MNEVYKTLEFDKILQILSSYSKLSINLERIESLSLMFDKNELKKELQKLDESIKIINQYGSISFDYIHNILDSVEKARKNGICNEEELYRIGKQASGIKIINEMYANVKEDKYPLMSYYLSTLIPLKSLEKRIDEIIGDDMQVLDTASPDLHRIRKEIINKNLQIRKKLEGIIKSSPSYLADSLVTMRNDRLVIPVKSTYKNSVNGIIHDESASQMTAFIEPEAVVLLNNEIASLRIDERKEVERILRTVSKDVADNAETLINNFIALQEIDFIFAKAKYAIETDSITSEIADNNEVKVIGARHPLIDKNKVISNSFKLGAENPNIMLITGPNTGGKTVALKTLGLLALMNQTGLAVPANESTLPIYKDFYVDIGDSQSLEQSLSTFSSHLLKLKRMVENANDQSLVIIDEIGGGTDPSEGESIAMSVLDYFHAKKTTVLVSTHYSNLKSYGLEKNYILSCCMKFDEETLKPTYKLISNLSGRSYAFEIAQSLSFNNEIIDSAKKYREHYLSSSAMLAEKLDKELLKAHEQQEKLDKLIDECKQKENEINQLKLSLIKEKEKLSTRVNEIVEEKVNDAMNEVNKIMDELKNNENKKLHEVIEAKTKLKNLHQEANEESRDTSNHIYHIGDAINIIKLNRVGRLSSLSQDDVTVELNGKTLRMKKTDIEPTDQSLEKKVIVKANHEHKFVAVKPELNLIGEHVEEALILLENYLSECMRYNLKEVRIIHGYGTGALKEAVWNFLKKYKYIKSFEFASYENGGMGATVVIFK